jgi:hypothetical protein
VRRDSDGASGGTRRALLAVAVGHAAAIAVVIGAFSAGSAIDRARGATSRASSSSARRPGVAAERGVAGSADRLMPRQPFRHRIRLLLHGHRARAGTMWIPALAPLCTTGPSASATAGSALTAAAAAVAVHTAAMLATSAVVTAGVRRGIAWLPGRGIGASTGRAASVALAATGIALMVVR